MHSNRYTAAPERKHRNLPRVLAATAAMLCIAALLLVLSVVQSHTASGSGAERMSFIPPPETGLPPPRRPARSSSTPAGNAPRAPTLQ